MVSPVLDRQGTDGGFKFIWAEEDHAMWRSRIMHRATYEERLAEEAQRLKEQAKKAAFGRERDLLLRKARQAETAAHVSEWITSPGLMSPK